MSTSRAPDETATASESSALRRGLVEEKVLEAAATLFADRGFGATSLEDIAERVGMKRPSLYHYFKSKDDILAHIIKNLVDRGTTPALTAAAREDLDPPAKLYDMARALCMEVASRPQAFRLVFTSQANLATELAARLENSKRTVTQAMTDVIASGIRTGHFRTVEPRLAALAVLGMCNWPAWWFVPGPDNPVEPVAESIAEQAVRSVKANDGQPQHGGNPRSVLEAMRANLDALDALLNNDAPHPAPPNG